MLNMRRQHIAQLEEKLEGLVEAAFSSLMGNRLRAQDLALHLARAMEDHALYADQPRPIAPDTYQIVLRGDIFDRLVGRNPKLKAQLAEHLLDLAHQAGFRLENLPTVKLIADTQITQQFNIHASHSDSQQGSRTDAMQPVNVRNKSTVTYVAHLLTDDQRMIPLDQDVMNIGRHSDNHITLNDSAISRYHAQIRRRFNEHIIFSTMSKNGLYVNEVRVKEHRLKPGDVVRIGSMRLIYIIEDNDDDTTHPADTGILNPL
jgi:pSer/pThr/pTyr-binding forkhead associated (FHA) protein